jgi:prephenate dehydrogenase
MNIGIIGLGLIGGSLGRAIIKKTDNVVFGRDISPQVMLNAQLLDAYNFELTDADFIKLDMLIIAVYPSAFKSVLSEVAPKLKAGAIVADIAGTKRLVVEAMQEAKQAYPELQFVATHPMAGREFWGVEHSTAGLFEKASVLLLPVHTDILELTEVKELFEAIGFSNIVVTDDKTHDRIIAYTSQLAHIVSSSFVKSPTAEEHNGFSAGSFRALTRVARLNANMWTELMLENSDNLVYEIDTIIKNLQDYRSALADGDGEKLHSLLEDGNAKKEMIEKATRVWKRNQ